MLMYLQYSVHTTNIWCNYRSFACGRWAPGGPAQINILVHVALVRVDERLAVKATKPAVRKEMDHCNAQKYICSAW